MRVRFSRRARLDRREIDAYYRERSPAAAARFKTQLEKALRYVAEYPHGARQVSARLRAKVVLDFPYSIIYEVAGDEIIVAALACHYRAPERYDP